MIRRAIAIVVAAVAAATCATGDESAAVKRFALPEGVLLGEGPRTENSGIVKSRQAPNLFWMHNDSGDEPRIYPVREDGTVYTSERYPDAPGVLIGGAINVDWEDVAVTTSGLLVIADCGNNANDRRDLALYFVPEPAAHAGRTAFLSRVFFRYPEQDQFPAPKDDFNYDAEAIFTLGDEVYLCTKHRSDRKTRLYRLPAESGDGVRVLEFIQEFDVRGQVTGADATADGSRICLLTYDAVWLFEVADAKRPLSGPVRWLPYDGAEDAEAICFADDKTLLMAEEASGRLFKLPLELFVEAPR